MKKIIYILGITGLVLGSCNPMDDIYNDINSDPENAFIVQGDTTYTLTEDDYASLDLENNSFDSEDEAKAALPDFIDGMYSFWGKGSSVTINYNLYVGPAGITKSLLNAASYELTDADYAASGSNYPGFLPSTDAETEITDLLSTKYADAAEGDGVLVNYAQYDKVPSGKVVFEQDFKADGIDSFTSVSVVGDDQNWYYNSSYGAVMSGYSSGTIANEDWLISPEIDLTSDSDLNISILQALNKGKDNSLVSVLISTDYKGDGDVSSATWDKIDFEDVPTGSDWTFVQSEKYDLSAYEGKKVYVAFKYTSTDSDAATWEIKDVKITSDASGGDSSAEALPYSSYFIYSQEEWSIVDSSTYYTLTTADYDAMGTGSGQPGQYNNFSSSVAPEDYIPTYLKLKYPYAQEDDQLVVFYAYYSGGVTTRANLYMVQNGVWTPYQTTQEASLQFGNDGSTWVPDNTIKYTLVNSDYELMADKLADDPVYNGNLTTLSNYHDFDYNWTADMKIGAIGVLLNNLFPNAEVGQKYLVTYLVYNSGTYFETLHMIKTSEGTWIVVE
ncbi:choice-of-anchor J domain-containing protein [Zhouia sp. PK063]|uniref:choice-of-anchor J domain-containing protein n=1 Tax=Zhouia sp. PK063 TaxID=3373602 RepID=UPI00379C840B